MDRLDQSVSLCDLDEISRKLRTLSQILGKLRVQVSYITRTSREDLRCDLKVLMRNRHFAYEGVSVVPALELQIRHLNDSEVRGEYQVALIPTASSGDARLRRGKTPKRRSLRVRRSRWRRGPAS